MIIEVPIKAASDDRKSHSTKFMNGELLQKRENDIHIGRDTVFIKYVFQKAAW